jgi:hypothetical protein
VSSATCHASLPAVRLLPQQEEVPVAQLPAALLLLEGRLGRARALAAQAQAAFLAHDLLIRVEVVPGVGEGPAQLVLTYVDPDAPLKLVVRMQVERLLLQEPRTGEGRAVGGLAHACVYVLVFGSVETCGDRLEKPGQLVLGRHGRTCRLWGLVPCAAGGILGGHCRLPSQMPRRAMSRHAYRLLAHILYSNI